MYFYIFESTYADTDVSIFQVYDHTCRQSHNKLLFCMLWSLFVSYWHEWTRISTALSLQCGLSLQNEKRSLALIDVWFRILAFIEMLFHSRLKFWWKSFYVKSVAYLKQDDSHGFTEAFHLQGPSHMCSSTSGVPSTLVHSQVSVALHLYVFDFSHHIFMSTYIYMHMRIRW